MAEANARMLETAISRNLAARETHPNVLYDIHYDHLTSNPIGTIRNIYEHFRMELSQAYLARLQAYVAAHPKDRHGQQLAAGSLHFLFGRDILEQRRTHMAFWKLGTLQLEEFRPGIMSKAEIGNNLIMAYMQIGPGKEDTGHEHSFDQCGIVLEGRIEMFVGQERKTLGADECYFIPSGERHGWKTFDDPVRILDISPRQP